ncbi:MAG: hypothetical protein AB7N65_14880 [Vicinamibacterales bacterium]
MTQTVAIDKLSLKSLTLLLAVVAWLPPSPADAQERFAKAVRDGLLRRAQVWMAPPPLGDPAALERNPEGPGGFEASASVECRFEASGVGGSTPKFDCELPDGDEVKVKYGRDNPEVFSEVIASRLLAAIGFPADRMYVVERVRCFGCPPEPFKALQCLNDGTPKAQCFPKIDYDKSVTFEDAVIERPIKGLRIELRRDRGWRWDELSKIDPAAGGAPRSHVDALRLMGVFLAHWDNKSKNQRLLCPGTPKSGVDGKAISQVAPPCDMPLAMVHDLGDAFGPFKLDLEGWRQFPVWADAAACRVSMMTLPYGGSTFPDTTISEAGRAFLAERLRALTPDHLRALLSGARLERYRPAKGMTFPIDEWVHTFQEKIAAVVDRPACPR